MIPVQVLIYWGRAALSLGCRLSRYVLRFLWWQPKAILAAKVLALESQLFACKQPEESQELSRQPGAQGQGGSTPIDLCFYGNYGR